jgi:hypothetical protein
LAGRTWPPKGGAVHLDFAGERGVAGLCRHGLPQLVHQHERGLVLDVEVAGELNRRRALRCIHDQADRCEQIDERELA